LGHKKTRSHFASGASFHCFLEEVRTIFGVACINLWLVPYGSMGNPSASFGLQAKHLLYGYCGDPSFCRVVESFASIVYHQERPHSYREKSFVFQKENVCFFKIHRV